MRAFAFAAVTAVALVVAPSALGASAVYGGTVKSGEPIVLNADAKAKVLKSVTVAFEAPCPGGVRVPPFAAQLKTMKVRTGFAPMGALGVSKNAGGKFVGMTSATSSGDGSSLILMMTLKGTLSKGKASGTMSGTVSEVTDAGDTTMTCETGVTKWTASRKAGVIFGGATSQGEPIVVRVSSNRRKISDLMYSWMSECVPEGFFHNPFEPLGNFSLSSKGVFGDSWSNDYQRDDGGTNRWSYDIRGKIGKTAAAGTLQTSFIDMNSSGGTDHTCDSGKLSWKAITG